MGVGGWGGEAVRKGRLKAQGMAFLSFSLSSVPSQQGVWARSEKAALLHLVPWDRAAATGEEKGGIQSVFGQVSLQRTPWLE